MKKGLEANIEKEISQESFMANTKKELNYGETPWDNLSKEELLLEIKRMYSALNSCAGALYTIKSSMAGTNKPFWGAGGTGGRALEKSNQVIDKINKQYSAEDLYRAFYRYADDLLFDNSRYKLGFNWVVCPICGTMLGDEENKLIGKHCNEAFGVGDCKGILRHITWDDLKPNQSK